MNARPAAGSASRPRPRRPAGRAWPLGVFLVTLLPGPSGAQAPAIPPRLRAGPPPLQAGARVRPSVAELGQRVTYRGWVLNPVAGYTARWMPLEASQALTWGMPTVRRGRTRGRELPPALPVKMTAGETLSVEIPLQAFVLGKLTVPGLAVEIDAGRGPRLYRLPVVTLDVTPVLTAADSNADYRQLHAPIAAPWWERVPWRWVLFGLLAIAAVIAAIILRRRRRPVPAAAPAKLPVDPGVEALAALAALRALNLPEHGRFAEHAFRLGQILRRYLEAVTGVARPGDTTPELVLHLKAAALPQDDQARLAGLLRVWDRVKFARDPYTLDEAVRAERAVETFLRRPAGPVERVA